MLEQARGALQNKEFKRAQALYRSALENSEDSGLVHEGLCVAAYYLKEAEIAEAEARLALDANTNLHEPHLILSYLLARRGQVAAALGEATEALRLVPSSGDVLAFAGGLHLARGNVGEARVMLEQALSINPNDWLTHYNLGTLLRTEGNYAAASAEYWRSLRMRRSWLTLRMLLLANLQHYRIVVAAVLAIATLLAYSYRSVLLISIVTVPIMFAGLFAALQRRKGGVVMILLGLVPLLIFFITK